MVTSSNLNTHQQHQEATHHNNMVLHHSQVMANSQDILNNQYTVNNQDLVNNQYMDRHLHMVFSQDTGSNLNMANQDTELNPVSNSHHPCTNSDEVR
jgi:hypothetical protein